MTPNLWLASEATNLATVATLVVAALGFLFGAWRTARGAGDRVNDLVRQRDEARADLDDCERRCRTLERSMERLANGGK